MRRSALIVFSVLLLDQISKIWIKTHLFPGEEIPVFSWFIIHFTENNGMAFGLEFGGMAGKIFLTVFRIVASGVIGWYLLRLIKKKAHIGLITCFSLIFAGAIGNIIDSTFYGLFFTDDTHHLSKFLSDEGGYGKILQGRVVDMLYFPLVNGQYPSWIPFFGGEPFQFFRPVFNVADSSITVGIFIFMIFQNRFNKKTEEEIIENREVEATEKSEEKSD